MARIPCLKLQPSVFLFSAWTNEVPNNTFFASDRAAWSALKEGSKWWMLNTFSSRLKSHLFTFIHLKKKKKNCFLFSFFKTFLHSYSDLQGISLSGIHQIKIWWKCNESLGRATEYLPPPFCTQKIHSNRETNLNILKSNVTRYFFLPKCICSVGNIFTGQEIVEEPASLETLFSHEIANESR